MSSVLDGVDSQVVLLIAAVVVVVLGFRLIFQIFRVGAGSILGIVAIILGLQYLFGIAPKQLWFEIGHLPQMAMRFFQSLA
ncbi:MAG: hypothetical protein ACHWZW_17150 [Spirulina sp.]